MLTKERKRAIFENACFTYFVHEEFKPLYTHQWLDYTREEVDEFLADPRLVHEVEAAVEAMWNIISSMSKLIE